MSPTGGAEVVNLRRARKRKAREVAAEAGAAGRACSGVSRGERGRAEAEVARVRNRFEAHRLDRPASEPPGDD